MAENFVSKFDMEVDDGTTTITLKDSGARSLVAQEIADRSALIKTDGSGNTLITTGEKIVESSHDKETTVLGTNSTHVGGSNTVNIDGSNTVNIDSAHTEVYGSTYGKTVTGKSTVHYNGGSEEVHKLPAKVTAPDLTLDIANGLTYKTPVKIDDYFNYVPAKSTDGTEYKILVKGSKDIETSSKNYHKAIIVGDSWAVGYYNGEGHPGEGWGDFACPLLGISADNILTIASGGSGFCNRTGENFDAQIQRAYDEYPAFRDSDIIICVGGFNDAQDNQPFGTVQSKAGSFFGKCKLLYPNAETHVFPLQLPYGEASVLTPERSDVLSAIKQAFYNQTGGNLFLHDGVHRWANSFGVGASAGDGSHLNQYGYNYMGQLLAMCIKQNGSYYPTLTGSINTTEANDYLGTVIQNKVVETNGIITVSFVAEANALPGNVNVILPDFAFKNNPTYTLIGTDLWAFEGNRFHLNDQSGNTTGFITLNTSWIAGI